MKFSRTSMFGICILSTLAFSGCLPSDPPVETKRCNSTSECGDASRWKCNIETNTCEELNPSHCYNQLKDNGETDVDCGSVCPTIKCEFNKGCLEHSDCMTNNCGSNHTCIAKPCANDNECATTEDPNATCHFETDASEQIAGVCISCFDGIQNGDEIDADCGGKCAKKCDKGQKCHSNTDCVTGQCTSGVCAGDIPNAPTASDLVINEVLPAANKASSFETIGSGKSCDFAEIVNVGTKPVSLEGVKLVVQRTDKEEKAAEYDLNGVLAPKQAAVVHACAESPFSGTEDFLPIFHEKFDLTNSGLAYTLSLKLGETQLTSVNYAIDKEHSAKSLNLNPDLNISNPTLTYHNELSELSHSPGLCMNGQPFSTDCIDSCSNNIKDNDESDIDCGGSCDKCVNGKTCNTGADCLTGTCNGGTCAGDMPHEPTKGDLVINEIMSNAKTSAPFDNTDVSKQCDFIEILNVSDKTISLNNVVIHTSRDNKDEKKTLPLQGSLTKNQVALYHACDEANGKFPSDILAISNTGFKFVNDAGYTVQLLLNESTELASVVFTKQSQGISSNLTQDKNTADTTLVPHNTVSELPYSPGRCTNGASFANNCVDTCGNGKKDGNETDVDCGGSCAACELGKSCTTDTDCTTGSCSGNKCASTCDNKKLDGNETDVDCGGSCELCEDEKICKTNSDCISNYCNENKCTACTDDEVCGAGAFCAFGSCVACETPDKGELVINEALGKLSKETSMVNCPTCTKEVEFIELYNKSYKRLNLSNLSIKLVKEEDGAEKSIPLKNFPGCLDNDQYLVIFAKDVVLKDANSVVFKHSNATLNDGKAYHMTIQTSDNTIIHEAYMPAHDEAGVSMARSGEEDDTKRITLEPHNTLKYYSDTVEAKLSPGLDNFTSMY